MSVDPTANKEQGSAHWCGVATHLLTTTLFGVGVFRQGVQSLETRRSIRQLWPNLKFTQQNEVLGFSLSQRSPPLPLLCFLFCTEEEKLLLSVHNPNLNFANVRRCWFDLCVQNPPKCTVEICCYASRWRGVAPRVTTRKEQIGLHVPPKSLLVNWIDLWKLCGDSQTIPAQ